MELTWSLEMKSPLTDRTVPSGPDKWTSYITVLSLYRVFSFKIAANSTKIRFKFSFSNGIHVSLIFTVPITFFDIFEHAHNYIVVNLVENWYFSLNFDFSKSLFCTEIYLEDDDILSICDWFKRHRADNIFILKVTDDKVACFCHLGPTADVMIC